jgi:plasmid segregation protein ParM
MPQPMGTLISIATNKDGTTHKSAKDYFSKKMLIFDAGYGTLDVFYLNKHTLDAPKCKTFSHYGMLAVMQECVKILKEAPYEKEISLTALQQVLEDGSFRGKFDRKTRSSGILDFAPILKEANEKIAREALNTIDEVYNCLTDEDYLVVTGGTGIAWLPFIKEYYGNIEGLTILIGSQGDDLPEIFANVRGYYFNLLNSFRSKA